jgi:PilZ domain
MMMDERRRTRRIRVLKSGKILLGKQQVPCAVRNISESGACLEVQTTYGIPAAFQFTLPDHPTRNCKVIWLNDRKIGVRFE